MPRPDPQIKPGEAPISASVPSAAACLAARTFRSARSFPRHRRARPPEVRGRAGGRVRTGRAAAIRRSCAPRSRSGIIRGVPQQDHRAMTASFRGGQGVVHQRRADAELATGWIDRQRAQHQRRDASGADVPQPQGSDQAALRRWPRGQGLRRAHVRRAGAGRSATGGSGQSRHRAALRARRRPRRARRGSRTRRRRACWQRGSSARQSWHVSPRFLTAASRGKRCRQIGR